RGCWREASAIGSLCHGSSITKDAGQARRLLRWPRGRDQPASCFSLISASSLQSMHSSAVGRASRRRMPISTRHASQKPYSSLSIMSIAFSIFLSNLRSRSRARSSSANSSSWVARSFGSGRLAASSCRWCTVRSASSISSWRQASRILRKCVRCVSFMYSSPLAGIYGAKPCTVVPGFGAGILFSSRFTFGGTCTEDLTAFPALADAGCTDDIGRFGGNALATSFLLVLSFFGCLAGALAAVFLTAGLVAGADFFADALAAAGLLAAAFFTGALATALLAGFLAVAGFLLSGLPAGFFAATCFVEVFSAALFAGVLLAADFFAGAFFAGAFLAGAFLAGAFVSAAFLAAAFFAGFAGSALAAV